MLGGVLFGAAALLPAISEGRGGGSGRGGRGGGCNQTQSQCRQLSQNCPQDRQRLRDGSCGNQSCPQNSKGCRNGGGSGAAGSQDGSGTPSKQ